MSTTKKWRVAGINFDHMHMGDLLRMSLANPNVEVVGISDEQPDRVFPVLDRLNISREKFFPDYKTCLEKTRPDVVILCPATAAHAASIDAPTDAEDFAPDVD